MFKVGIDEAGRGPCLGPLVVGAVKIPEGDISLLENAGIKDSKELRPKRRIELAEWLRNTGAERGWSLATISATPEMIDLGMAAGSLNEVEVDMFASLVGQVVVPRLRASRGTIHLDACDINAARFGNNVANRLDEWRWGEWRIVSEHGADSIHSVVGAASILAKVERDSAVEELSEKLGLNLGSGYPSDPVTIAAVKELVNNDQPDENLRWRWKTVQNAWKEIHAGEIPARPAQAGLLARSTLLDY